ncbi:VWFA and cache domain-containing protein 1-like [Ylistrum balloti]|uniref:VWFA and cache domain-containing protein 1-like n=1 Tax=Ylistrum balloti TaxID=509963 RepID=UPI0029058623|nr:VWFA and cache domain-containing protein 1-like [Ylistrum balloti]
MANCCNVSGTPNLKFQANVSFSGGCWTVSPKSPQTKKFANDAVVQTMRDNFNANPRLLWQYFGGEDGTSVLYPQAKVSPIPTLCNSFDPRFRPYYAAAATPIAKDVVVLVDTSTSMHTPDNTDRTRLKLAKEVATIALQTLNPNDRMAVVSFNPETPKPTSGCYENQLSQYTPENERFLSSFIGHLDVNSESDVTVGLEAAFHYFGNSSMPTGDEKRYKVILVLSDGADFLTDKHPLDVIRDENAKLGNQIYIMVYGIGNDIADDAKDLLRDMSLQTRNNETAKVGFFEIIAVAESVRSKMGSYYSFFKSSATDIVLSDPFIDTFSSIGLLISVCLPVYDKVEPSVLLGVACADVKLSDLFEAATVFNEGDSSYVFIIDHKGRTLKHPLLRLSRSVRTSYTLLDISYLERANGAKAIIDAMKRRETGKQDVLSSTRTMARGVVLMEGILTRTVKSTYHYAPIPNSDYSICVVVGEDATIATLPTQIREPGKFVYHRRDIYDDHLRSCKNFKRFATTEHSIVQFNADAFLDISKYLYEEENTNTVDRYTKFFNGDSSTANPGFTSEVINSVIVSVKAEEIWKAKSELALIFIWRYYGTNDGFIRVFPGIQLPHQYDHQLRPWWRRTKSQRGTLIMTTPYLDAWGAGLVVTLCRSIYTGRQDGSPHTELDDVEGVIGSDIGLSYLYRMLAETYPECSNGQICMLVDNSGFIIIHPDFVDPNLKETEREKAVENIHIVQKESDIARDLISKSVMSKQSCADFDNHKLQFTYRIQLNDGDVHIIGSGYELWNVKNTNVFLIRKPVADVSVQCCTDIPMVSPTRKKCSGTFCECICHTPIAFDTCLNINSKTGASLTCIAKTPDITSTAKPDDLSGLEDCYNPICFNRTRDSTCYSVPGCSWCVRDENAPLANPCCRGIDTCDFGTVLGGKSNVCPDLILPPTTPVTSSPGTQETTVASPSGSGDVSVTVVVGAILGSLVVILLIVIIGMSYRRHIGRRKDNPADDYLTALPSVRDASTEGGVVNQQYAGMNVPFGVAQNHGGGPNLTPMHHNANPNKYNTMPGSSSSSGSSGTPQTASHGHMPLNAIPSDPKL